MAAPKARFFSSPSKATVFTRPVDAIERRKACREEGAPAFPADGSLESPEVGVGASAHGGVPHALVQFPDRSRFPELSQKGLVLTLGWSGAGRHRPEIEASAE